VIIKDMKQVLVSLKMPGVTRLEILDSKRKELVILGNILRSVDAKFIAKQVTKAFDVGATKEDILMVASFVLGEGNLNAFIELSKAVTYEESRRAPYISAIDDCKEID
jgi:alkylhydroperoxidase/carboxymuconolactone decarboxylase family protein YurZ